MKKGVAIAAAFVLAASVTAAQVRRGNTEFRSMVPVGGRPGLMDTASVGGWNVFNVSKGGSAAANEYAQSARDLADYLGGATDKEICQRAAYGGAFGKMAGGVDYTLMKAIKDSVNDCENFAIRMFDALKMMGREPSVAFVEGHVILELGKWCVEANGATGRRKMYPSDEIGLRYDTVYLQTDDPVVLRVFAYIRLAAEQANMGRNLEALGYYEDAIKVSGGKLPEPVKGAWKMAKALGLKQVADEYSKKYRGITGRQPDEPVMRSITPYGGF